MFRDGEVREAAVDMVKELYRVSARYHLRDLLLRGTKMSLTWQRPHDTRAKETLANVPRCRIPQVVCRIEDEMRHRSMPSLQILNTRDYNYRPTRHIMLEIVYGESIAQDISDLTCMQWLNWCRLSVDNATAFYDIHYFVARNMNCDNTNSNNLKRSRDDDGGDDTDHEYDTDDTDTVADRAVEPFRAKNGDARMIGEWIEADIKDNPYAPLVAPSATSKKPSSKKGKKKKHVEEIDDDDEEYTGEVEAVAAAATPSSSTPPSVVAMLDVESGDSGSNFPPLKNYSAPRGFICTARPKSINAMKKNTGRMGFNDMYFVALTCAKEPVSANCRRAASRLSIPTDSGAF